MRTYFYGQVLKKILPIAIITFLVSCNGDGTDKPDDSNRPPAPQSLSYSFGDVYPHDTSSFTEGLLFYKGKMYESTGLEGESKLLEVDLKSGKATRSLDLDPKLFGEGIAILNDTIYQLTYLNKVVLVYTLKDFKKVNEFKLNTQGWGLTTNGKELIASDGSSYLYYYDPSTFRLLRKQEITEAGSLSFNLNELEYIDGYIYANQWQYPYIFKIDPASGHIVGKADLSEKTKWVKLNYPDAEFLNGIAYDSTTKKTYITGKKWPELYEINFK